jgi:DNA primase
MNDRIEQIKRDNPIVEYLAVRGIFHVRQSGADFYYLSPLPEHQGEKSPSFHVNSRKNVWYDFALGIGGDIINLHEKLTGSREGLSSTFIHNSHTQKVFYPVINMDTHDENNENKIKIDKVGILRNNNLLNYMAERGISSEVTKKFCEEVHYTVKSKQYYAVGFITDNNGYVLRNKYSKIFYNPQPNKPNNKLTTIGGRAQNSKCLVFEGFCDFLAYMELERKGDTVVKSIGEVERAYILNSTSTLSNPDVMAEITRHKEVFGFFDNDKTGYEAAQKLMHELNRAGGIYHHAMPYSPEYNDLNDYLCHTNNKKIEKNIAEMDEIKNSDMTEEQWCLYDAKKCDFVHRNRERETIENKTETQKKLKQISCRR